MEKKKKIIIGVVSTIMVIALGLVFKFMIFNDGDAGNQGIEDEISILLPTVDKQLLSEEASKKEEYDNQHITEDESKNILLDELNTSSEDDLEKQQLEAELAKVLEMQKQMELQRLQSMRAASNRRAPVPVNGATANPVADIAKILSKGIENGVRGGLPGGTGSFYGAGSFNSSTELDLVPAETVDQGVLVNGSTIAIRTKEPLRLRNPNITIPKDAVVYGKVTFAGVDRLDINIVSYKTNKKLYNLNLQVYDFDGRPGVHLSNRSWSKIPGKVTNDVFRYAFQRGTQQPALGGAQNSVSIDEAKDIAALSAANEVAQELFDKRRVMVPRKYHLWINITDDGNAGSGLKLN